MSKCIAERYGEYSSHDCALLAIESLLNVDDALSWLPLMAKAMKEVRGADEPTQLACIFVNLCQIRHLVLRANVTTDNGIIGYGHLILVWCVWLMCLDIPPYRDSSPRLVQATVTGRRRAGFWLLFQKVYHRLY